MQSADSPAQGAKDIPAQKSVAEDGTIKVTVAMIGAPFPNDEARLECLFKLYEKMTANKK